jgi:photosystem II stability/assembly factor-like uncharacterized protein
MSIIKWFRNTLIICAITLSYIASAQVSYIDLNVPPAVQGKNFFSVSSKGANMYVAGDGCLLKTTNSGDSWTVMHSDDNVLFFDVKFANINTGYAVGFKKSENFLNKHALLYKTDDAGATWFLLFESVRKCSVSGAYIEGFMRNGAIDLLDESRLIWGVGSNNFYSYNGGRANHNTLANTQSYSAVIANMEKAYIGSSGTLESFTGGVGYGSGGLQSYDYFDMDLVTKDQVYSIATSIQGRTSLLAKINVNQINDYQTIEVNIAEASDVFFGLDFFDVNSGYIVGKAGKVFSTVSAGESWEDVSGTSTSQLNDILFYEDSNAIIVGNDGALIKMSIVNDLVVYDAHPSYNESLSVWDTIDSGTSSDLFEIETTDNNVYIVGDGLILKSSDQGQSFSSIFSNSNYQFRDVSFIDDNTGWVIGNNTRLDVIEVLKTVDGGSNWDVQTSMSGGVDIVGLVVEAKNSDFIFASVSLGVIREKKYSSDGGLNWITMTGNAAVTNISDFVYFGSDQNIDEFKGFAPTKVGGGSYSMNISQEYANTFGGCNSFMLPGAVKEFGMNAISTAGDHLAISRDHSYIGGSNIVKGYFERTNVGNPTLSSHWACYPTYAPINMYGIKMIDENNIWMVGDNGTIISTANGGILSATSDPYPQMEWYGHDSKVYARLHDVDVIGMDVVISIGEEGTIVRTGNAAEESYTLIPSTNPIQLATLGTTTVSSITETTAVSGGNITDNGGGTLTSRGICWSTNSNPTIVDNSTVNGSGIGSFVSDLSGLTGGTTYYLRAYAINSAGTSYGNEVSFTTTNSVQLATLSTSTVSSITETTAVSGGNITDNGGGTVTSRGICWSTSSNPTIADNSTLNGSGIGSFVSDLSGLTGGTTYYVRAYAINSAGTSYGNEVSFVMESNSIYEINSVDYIIAYPNPTREKITFFGMEDVNLIEILNLNGQIIAKLKFPESIEIVGFDVSKFSSGIYVAKITGDSRIESITFVKK